MQRPSFINVGPALTDKEIDAAEAELGVTFPEPYRRFLLQTNGGRPEPHIVGGQPIHTLYGIRDDLHYSLIRKARFNWENADPALPTEYLAVGHTVFGDTIGLHLRTGKVYCQDHEEDEIDLELDLMSEDFDAFLDAFQPVDRTLEPLHLVGRGEE
jgi:hypothetical protein